MYPIPGEISYCSLQNGKIPSSFSSVSSLSSLLVSMSSYHYQLIFQDTTYTEMRVALGDGESVPTIQSGSF